VRSFLQAVIKIKPKRNRSQELKKQKTVNNLTHCKKLFDIKEDKLNAKIAKN
jgi:hypothetical protein